MTPVHVLVIDDSAEEAMRLIAQLRDSGYAAEFERVSTTEGMRALLSRGTWDLVLSDFRLERFGALEALAILREQELEVPFLIVSEQIGEETAVRAIKAGAHNCIPRHALARLGPTVEHELREAQIRRERQQARRSLRESEARFRALAESAPDAILIATSEGEIVFVNRAAERIFGHPVAAMIGQPLAALVPDLAGPFADRASDASGPAAMRELSGRHACGAEIPIELSVGSLEREDRRLVTVIARDITERRHAARALKENEQRLRALVRNAPVILFELDREGVFTQSEGKALETLGLRPGEVVGRSALATDANYPETEATIRRALRGEAFAERVVLGDVAFDVQFAPRPDSEGRPDGVIGVATDVTEQSRAQKAADQSEQRYRVLFERNLAGVYRTSLEGEFLDCNDSFARILGFDSRQEVLGLRAWDFYLSPEDRQTMIARLKERRLLENHEQRLRRRDGTFVWILENASLVEGPHGEAVIEGTVIDITERKRAEERVRQLAFHDPLTGLPNRLLFRDRLAMAIRQANRSGRKVAVLYLDLDRFKLINDSLGHSAGDTLLRRVGERLAACVREGDTVARLGGDEFIVLAPGLAAAEDSGKLARKILDAVRHPFVVEGRELFVTLSIGVVVCPEDGQEPETLIRNADVAMYRAKEQGRDNCQLYTPSMNTQALERLSLEGQLRQALANGDLVLHYQPVIELSTNRVRGAEALLRWQHPSHGLLGPAEFIDLAEAGGLIVPIGEWALHTACAQARAWQDRGFPRVGVAVNLSVRQFQQSDLVGQIGAALEATGLAPGSLDIEISESNAMQNAEISVSALSELKKLGVSVSLDDFGTGHSSLSDLRRFPIDRIKIDRSFVQDIPQDPDAAAIASAIIAMAHRLELAVVAEGVETEAQLAFLRQRRCDEIQGLLFSAAVPATELEEILSSGRRLVARSSQQHTRVKV